MANQEQLFAEIETVLERLITQQRDKIVEVALDILPDLAPEQLHDPHDYPEVSDDAMFNFEDGFLGGLISARAALRNTVFAAHRSSAS